MAADRDRQVLDLGEQLARDVTGIGIGLKKAIGVHVANGFADWRVSVADTMAPARTVPQYYYWSLDVLEATHPQTLLAYELNNAPLPVKNGPRPALGGTSVRLQNG